MLGIWGYTIISILVVSAVSLVGVFTLGVAQKKLDKALMFFVALSAGALFGDVFIHLLPELMKDDASLRYSVLILVGILVFFALEKFLRWRHTHKIHTCVGDECDKLVEPVGYVVIFSDGIHNFIDGLIIGASFMVSVPVGVATTIAVILHEVPQEIGDFGVLLHSGFSKGRALLFNFLSGMAALLGGVLVLIVGARVESFTSIIISIGIGGFVYLAGSDLVPELQKTNGLRKAFIQFSAMTVGVVLMLLLVAIE